MSKYKKCPRCDINYILESEDLCEICKEELRGISHEELLVDVDDETICPKCGIHFLCEGETICEDCAQKLANDKDSEGLDEEIETERAADWSIPEEETEVVVPEIAAEEPDVDPLSLENLAEEEVDTTWTGDKFDDEAIDDLDVDLELNADELAELGTVDEEEAILTEEEEKELEEELPPVDDEEEEEEDEDAKDAKDAKEDDDEK